jgi:hypothetical protein
MSAGSKQVPFILLSYLFLRWRKPGNRQKALAHLSLSEKLRSGEFLLVTIAQIIALAFTTFYK